MADIGWPFACAAGRQEARMAQRCRAGGEGGAWWADVQARYLWRRVVFYDLHAAYEADPRMFGHELRYLVCLLQRGEIVPKVAGRVSLNQVPKSQRLIEKVSICLCCFYLMACLSAFVGYMIMLTSCAFVDTCHKQGLPNGTVVCLPWKRLDPKQKVKVERVAREKPAPPSRFTCGG